MPQVVKRDNRVVQFDASKIENAVLKAFIDVDKEVTPFARDKAHNIAAYIEGQAQDKTLTIEQIQDYVENGLMATKRKDVARAYMSYRMNRTIARERKSSLHKAIEEKILASDVKNQNANVDEHSFGGRKGEADSVYMKQYALNYLISDKARFNHENNRIYIHDLDNYAVGSHNCLTVPFDHLLSHGFTTRQTDVRPARSISTAMQLVAVIFQLQSLDQFGGVSASHIDTSMVPYVRMSFKKHYITSYVLDSDDFDKLNVDTMTEKELDDFIDEHKDEYMKKLNLTDSDFTFDSTKLDEHLKKKAIFLTRREVYQAVEATFHNLNTLQSRSGNQLPFTSINFGLDTSQEGRLVTRALLEKSIEGVGSVHRTSVFPCSIFQVKSGINKYPDDPNYDLFMLALKSTSLRLYPNYANANVKMQQNWVKMDREVKHRVINELSDEDKKTLAIRLKENPSLQESLLLDLHDDGTFTVHEEEVPIEVFSTMGCRTQNGFDCWAEHSFRENVAHVIKDGTLYDNYVSGAQKDGRGNICPATIILPTLAMEAREKVGDGATENELVETFMNILSVALDDTRDELMERFEHICSQSAKSAPFMYPNNTMYGYVPAEGIRSALRHGTLAVGQLGIAETLQLLIGCDQTNPKGLALAERIEQLYEKKCNEFKKKYHLNFGVYFTPAENLCYTAMLKFQSKYGKIKGVSDKDFFTNSMHVPVWDKIDPFKKIDIESKLTKYSTAGCITYIELDNNCRNNLKVLEQMVVYAMDHDVPYFAINVPNDTCLDCGYTGEFNDHCPVCGSKHIQQLRRVTGYLTGNYTTAFNKGKQEEVRMRYKHSNSLSNWNK